MRILLATCMPPRPQAPGAIPVLLNALLASLTPQHEVTLVTVLGPDPEEHSAVENLRERGFEVHATQLMQPSQAQRWGRRWRLASTWLRGAHPWRTLWFSEPAIQDTLDTLTSERCFDLIQVEDNAMGVYQYPTQSPTLFTEYEVRRPRPVNWQGWKGESVVKWALREADWQRWGRYQCDVWRRFDRIQVFTPRDALSIKAIAPDLYERVRVNPFGIELPAQANPNREESETLLFVGNYTHAPNVDAALWLGQEIMPRLRERCPGVRLNLAGIYPPPAVQALASDDIALLGPVPDVEPYLEQATLVVAPLRIGGGMRMKVLHAMAMGKAVVTTSRGAEGLATEAQEPPLVIAEDTQGFVDAIVRLLAAPQARHTLGWHARAFVEAHYGPAAYARRIEAIYAELMPDKVALC